MQKDLVNTGINYQLQPVIAGFPKSSTVSPGSTMLHLFINVFPAGGRKCGGT